MGAGSDLRLDELGPPQRYCFRHRHRYCSWYWVWRALGLWTFRRRCGQPDAAGGLWHEHLRHHIR
eukprot:SAG31_NODE_1791_length_7258_cov_12.040928_1_plen_64_part_10